MELVKRNNVTDMDLTNRMDRVFDSFFNDDFFNFSIINDSFFSPLVKSRSSDIKNLDDRYVISLAVPGLTKNDLKMKLVNDTLTVWHNKAKEDKSGDSSSFVSKSFTKSFTIPSNADAKNISAECKNGLLNITIPKRENEDNTEEGIEIKIK